MNNYIINSSTLAKIGDTIRDKSGTSESIPVPEIPKHIENVYEAGKKSMVDESKLLPTTVSGNYISVDDVSEIPHEVTCKISGVDNPQNIKVTRAGRNLWSLTVDDYLQSTDVVGNGTQAYLKLKPNTKYTMSSNHIQIGAESDIWFNGTSTGADTVNAKKSCTKTTDENGYLFIALRSSLFEEMFANDWFQIVEGTVALPYEPTNVKIITPNADGTTKGMTSVSPHMNIFTDAVGVNIEATYNKSWGMKEASDRFCNALVQGVISHSISFEILTLSKENIKSIINALSSTATDQTITLKRCAKELFTDEEWAELIATKPNWTFSLV